MCDNHTKVIETGSNQSVLEIESNDKSLRKIDLRTAAAAVPSDPTARIWPWTRLVVWFISLYQRAAAGRPSPCRFTPSCSTYASEALSGHGLCKGSLLAVWRIMRCNPWGGEGFDPVPEPHSWPHRSVTGSRRSIEADNDPKER